jgi:hypothetical protein
MKVGSLKAAGMTRREPLQSLRGKPAKKIFNFLHAGVEMIANFSHSSSFKGSVSAQGPSTRALTVVECQV